MDQEFVVQIASEAFNIILLCSAPMLLVALIVGLLISIFQAMTQIQEQTLSFVPKLIGVLVITIVFGPWILNNLLEFTFSILNNLNQFIG